MKAFITKILKKNGQRRGGGKAGGVDRGGSKGDKKRESQP
jgi:hypothetical protein